MKEVQIDESIRRDRKLFDAIERANVILKEVIGSSSTEIRVVWSAIARPTEKLVKVEISDGMANSSEIFSVRELSETSLTRLRSSLNWLWGDFLQVQSHQLMAKLNRTMQELGKE